MKQRHPLELLAPARNADIAIAAIRHGADAVYIGAEGFGARAAAGNTVDDIRRVVDFAHIYRARVYVTVNTIIYDRELIEVERLVKRLYAAGVDALIVQDMALLRMDLPPVALHASTQCDTRTSARARFLQDAGFSQIVLPREMSLEEIAQVREVTDVPLEVFVHGALCVSYSGDCHASQVLRRRSANRGECAQICRLPYDLYDGAGHRVERDRHLLSLRDMNRAASLLPMIEAGVSSFKIEGRLKDAGYVKNVVAAYDRLLNSIVDASPELYRRQSVGRAEVSFTPALQKSFNRGFTSYFLNGTEPSVASVYTPKSQGEKVGCVTGCSRSVLEARLDIPLANGDGLGFFTPEGEFVGFRLNRVDGNRLYPATKVSAVPGTVLYRNSDKVFDDMLRRDTSVRLIDVGMTLRAAGSRLVLDLADERGNSVTATLTLTDMLKSVTDQAALRRRTLSKLGGTPYRLSSFDDRLGDNFVPAAMLTKLRRDGLDLLDAANRACYRRELRRAENRDARYPEAELDYHANVANRLAAGFYRSHGAAVSEPALEVTPGRGATERRVMTTRYCMRRELGACLKNDGASRLKGPLTLRSGDITLRLDFDCASCRMYIYAKNWFNISIQ